MNREAENRLRAIKEGHVSLEELQLRVAIYARVSTDSDEQKKSFDNQLETYQSVVENNPNWVLAGVYADEGITGSSTDKRIGLQALVADAQQGKFDLVIVKSISRFARNVKDTLVTLDTLEKCGVVVKFVSDNIISVREHDKLMLKFLALGAEMESKAARERTGIVFRQGISNGRVYGNGLILGYTKKDCSLVVDEQEAEIVRLIFDLYVHQRMGMRQIAKTLIEKGLRRRNGSKLATSSIQSVLKNPKYKGFYCGGKTVLTTNRKSRLELPEEQWVTYKDPAIPAIVSEELWDEAARIRAERSQKYREEVKAPENQGKYRYSKKIVSGIDPSLNYQRFLSRGKVFREGWHCRDWKHPENKDVIGVNIYSDELDELLVRILSGIIGGYDSILDNMIEQYREALSTDLIRKKLEQNSEKQQKIRRAIERAVEAYEAETLSLAELKKRKRKNEEALVGLQEERARLMDSEREVKKLLDGLEGLKEKMAAAIETEKPSREMIDVLIDKIVVAANSTREEVHLQIYFRQSKDFQNYTLFRKGQPEALPVCSDKPKNPRVNQGKEGEAKSLQVCSNNLTSMSASRISPS